MDRRYTQVFTVFFLLVDTVLSQEKVEGFTGGEAVLPCIYKDMVIKDVNIFWKDQDDKTVFDVLSGQPDTGNQDPAFKSRASDFPNEYGKGNFSLLLKDLKVTDSRIYSCFIAGKNAYREVDLKVIDKPVVPENPTARGGSVGGRERSLPLLLLALLHMLLPR